MRSTIAVLGLLGAASLVHAGIDVNGKDVVALGDTVPIDAPGTFWSQLEVCPRPCHDTPSSQWTMYTSMDEIDLCPEPMLLDLNIYNPVRQGQVARIRACTTTDPKKSKTAAYAAKDVFTGSKKRATAPDSKACLQKLNETEQVVGLGYTGQSGNGSPDHTLETLGALRKQLAHELDCEASLLFAYTNGTVAGLYIGSAVVKSSTGPWFDHIIDTAKAHPSAPVGMVSQLCGGWRDVNHAFGLSVDVDGNITAVQHHLSQWSLGKCAVDASALTQTLPSFTLKEKALPPLLNSKNSTHHGNLTSARHLSARGDCDVKRVGAGQGCWDMASACGVSLDDFKDYNGGSSFCDTPLQVDQRVCCSKGDLPDIRPKPDGNGMCFAQHVDMGDNCSKYAAKWGLTLGDIDKFNDGKTWGWTGCDNMLAGINICLSDGKPPLPAPVSNAVCGPTKPPNCDASDPNCKSQPPADGVELKDMNPCPLNACCNIWGQCGVSGDFCEEQEGPRGSPGTGPPGANSCVSSCGSKIVNNKDKPSATRKIAYYESWNFDRDCLTMQVAEIANKDYDHVHWGFGFINPNGWTVGVNDTFYQWESFKALTGVKRVLSLGGWGYSTEPATYDLLRQAMLNRNVFADNVVKFLQDEGIDGIDFDWEYPGAIDIDGTPPGKPDDGVNYFKFLTVLSSKLKKAGKSLSIAAPASYWYLKAFPIDKMAKVVDYIVFMTYDLHGQWDAGNKWSSEGCPEGNCLRSHINYTEVLSSLSMITKAGVSSTKIVVGEASYGRSFKMAQAGCGGPDCHFTGDRYHSNAAKGRCTGTAGYISNAEIAEIIAEGRATKQWYDKYTASDYLIYDETEWVAYREAFKKQKDDAFWLAKNFAGTVDWAVDLQEFTEGDAGGIWTLIDDNVPPPIPDCNGSYDTLDQIPKDVDSYCKNLYILQVLRHDLSKALDDYTKLLGKGYEGKFKTYAEAVARSGNVAVEDFMYHHGDSYFSCEVAERIECCRYCRANPLPGSDPDRWCRYCEGSCGDWDPSCTAENLCETPPRSFRKIAMPCPPDWSKRTEEPPRKNEYAYSSVYWAIRDDKKNQFYADLFTDKGIAQEKIKFQDVNHYSDDCTMTPRSDCQYVAHDYNFPVTDGYTSKDIFNPEDVVKNGHDRLTAMVPALDAIIDSIKKKTYPGSVWDAVDSVSLVVQSVVDAVKSMDTIEDTVDKWESEKIKGIILAFLTALFLFIPVAGEFIGAIAGLANVARIAALAGAVGNTALDIYNIIDNKDDLIMNIFSLVLEPLSLFDVAKIGKAAKNRRLMSAEDLKKLHKAPGGQIEKIDGIRNTCVRRKRSDALIQAVADYATLPSTRAIDLYSEIPSWYEHPN